MSLSNKHPQYLEHSETWESIRDFHTGSDAVKNKGTRYLPATEGMEIDGMRPGERGFKAYSAYKLRARVPDYIKEGVRALVGLLHQKPASISLPPQLEYLRENASSMGESLQALYRRINFEQLLTGRVGILTDIPSRGGMPYFSLYSAENISNWNVSEPDYDTSYVDTVVLNETSLKFDRETLGWSDEIKYRVLWLDENSTYRQKVFVDTDVFDPDGSIVPRWMGRTLNSIPFVFINSQDTLPSVSVPPLKSLLDICIGIYLGEADYRQNLYMQSQQTLVVIGGTRSSSSNSGDEDSVRTGAGARIDIDITGDAKYIGTDGNGLSEQRQALAADRKRAETKAGELVQNNTSQAESGAAISTRYNAQTATLNQLATCAGEGLTLALRNLATWVGADPDLVRVVPNTEFIDFSLDGQNFVDIMTAREGGLPLSMESIHEILADRGLTSLDFDTEMRKIEEEDRVYGRILLAIARRKSEIKNIGSDNGFGATTEE